MSRSISRLSIKVALLSDVHGNLPALHAVLEHARTHDVDQIWNLGDLVGYAPFPNEVIETLHQTVDHGLVGNYDLKALRFEKKRKKWKRSKSAEKYSALNWNHDHLSQSSREILGNLPEEERLSINGQSVLLVHASPVSNKEALSPETGEGRLTQLAHAAGADVVVCGHSHRAFSRRIAGTRFVNPGSVGRPEQGDWRASYAQVTFGTDTVDVAFFRVAYDIDRVTEAIVRAGLPERFCHVLRLGRRLEDL